MYSALKTSLIIHIQKSKTIRKEREIEGIKIGKEEIKQFLLTE